MLTLRLLDLFCGRWGWSKAFAARGWYCVGIDLMEPPEVPANCEFRQGDVMNLSADDLQDFDFICASSPCEEFSVHEMKHFHPNPEYPIHGLRLFNYTKAICEESGVPYVMENVRGAERFVGYAIHHCGPFYLWGNAVPPLLNQGIIKGMHVGSSKLVKRMTLEERRQYRRQFHINDGWSNSEARRRLKAEMATIPVELSNCIADYAERLNEQRTSTARNAPRSTTLAQ